MKTEQQTRIELIDAALETAGWSVGDPSQVVLEYDIVVDPVLAAERATPYCGRQFSDYVLLGRDRKPLAVVEAKKTSKDAAVGREQAKQYCYNIQKQLGGELTVLFLHQRARNLFLGSGQLPATQGRGVSHPR
jgi:type I restriction enzyme, R subunit